MSLPVQIIAGKHVPSTQRSESGQPGHAFPPLDVPPVVAAAPDPPVLLATPAVEELKPPDAAAAEPLEGLAGEPDELEPTCRQPENHRNHGREMRATGPNQATRASEILPISETLPGAAGRDDSSRAPS